MKGLLIKEWYSITGMSNFKMMLFFAVGVLGFGFLDNMRFMLLLLPLVAGIFHAMRTVSGSSSRWHYHTVAVKLYRQNIS